MPESIDTTLADKPTSPEQIAVAFARVLRGAGLTAPVDSVITFGQALVILGCSSRRDVYWAARAALVRRPEDLELFDRAFAVFWEHRAVADRDEETMVLTLATDSDDEPNDESETGDDSNNDERTITLRFSAAETLRHRDFASYTESEMDEARSWMASLRLNRDQRRSLRDVAARRLGHRPDVARTIRRSFAAGGEPLRRCWHDHGTKHRRLVLLLDVSGSMEPYARALVRFVHAAVIGRRRVEAFALGTRLTRITRELSLRDPDRALARATNSVHDWSGGTRLGETLRAFNDEWGVRGLARGATVVILSDGWDRGNPAALGEQMARLGRVAHRVVWVNPLKVTPGYAPLARGMAAALPHVDEFVEGHSLHALEHLIRVIDR